MNAYRFAAYPSNSSVASGVTMLVSIWFLVAAGAILADPSSPYTQRTRVEPSPAIQSAEASAEPAFSTVAVAPEVRFTINVVAHRAAGAHRSVNL